MLALRSAEKKEKTDENGSTSAVHREVPAPQPADIPLTADLMAYASLGSYLAENNHIPALHWSEPQFKAFERGVRATYEGRGFPVNDEAVKLRDEISAKVQAMLVDTKPADPIEDYFKTVREKEGVQRTSTGLHYRITQEGFGKKPGPDSTVVVSYGARLPDGTTVPSLTRARVRSSVRDLLPGIGEGVQLINPGGKILVYLSPALSFRDGPWPAGVPRGAPIIFFLELHDVSEKTE